MYRSATLPAGTQLGSYEVVRELGSGGMAVVFEGRHRALGKPVAIKTLHAPLASDAEVVARFLREARTASRLRHPHIVDVFDVGVHEGRAYLVMELLRGDTLRELLDRETRLTVEAALALLLPIASALEAAHGEGIVHRDLKPENVFVARPRAGLVVPKLLDFGIAKVREDGSSLTRQSEVFGTPYYMSPEQTRSAKRVDARSDQYSFAAVLYECVTGSRPFDAEHALALLVRIQEASPQPPRSLVPSLPEALDAAILRAMAREPDVRFTSMAAFARELIPHASEATRSVWAEALAAGRVSHPPSADASSLAVDARPEAAREPDAGAPRPAGAPGLAPTRPATAMDAVIDDDATEPGQATAWRETQVLSEVTTAPRLEPTAQPRAPQPEAERAARIVAAARAAAPPARPLPTGRAPTVSTGSRSTLGMILVGVGIGAAAVALVAVAITLASSARSRPAATAPPAEQDRVEEVPGDRQAPATPPAQPPPRAAVVTPAQPTPPPSPLAAASPRTLAAESPPPAKRARAPRRRATVLPAAGPAAAGAIGTNRAPILR